jgi:hypothetical protein
MLSELSQNLNAFECGDEHYFAVIGSVSISTYQYHNSEIITVDILKLTAELVDTIGIVCLSSCFFFQIHAHGYLLNRRVRYQTTDSIISYSNTSSELLIVHSSKSLRYVSIERDRVMATQIVISSPATLSEFIPRSDHALLAMQDCRLCSVWIGHDADRPPLTTVCKFESVPTGMQFATDSALCVGFANGSVIVGSLDGDFGSLQRQRHFHLGGSSVRFSRSFASSSFLQAITFEGETIKFVPLRYSGKVDCFCEIDPRTVVVGQGLSVHVLTLDGGEDAGISRHFIDTPLVDAEPLFDYELWVLGTSRQIFVAGIEGDRRLVFQTAEDFRFFAPGAEKMFVISSRATSSTLNSLTMNRRSRMATVQFCAKIQGRVDSAAELPGGAVVFGIGNSLLLYREHANQYLLVSQTDNIGCSIRRIAPCDSCVYIGDLRRSVIGVRYQEDRREFEVVAQDPRVRTVTALCCSRTHVISGDVTGTVCASNDLRSSPRRWPVEMAFHVGDVVTAVCGIDVEDDPLTGFLYATVGGEIGAFLAVKGGATEPLGIEVGLQMRHFKAVEMAVAENQMRLTGADFLRFRNETLPSNMVVDLDLLAQVVAVKNDDKEKLNQMLSFGNRATAMTADEFAERIERHISFVW